MAGRFRSRKFDGSVRLFKNGRFETQDSSLNNYDYAVDKARFGATNVAGATTSGSYYLDEFSSFRTLAP